MVCNAPNREEVDCLAGPFLDNILEEVEMSGNRPNSLCSAIRRRSSRVNWIGAMDAEEDLGWDDDDDARGLEMDGEEDLEVGFLVFICANICILIPLFYRLSASS